VVPTVVPIANDAFQGDALGQDEQGFLGGDLECPDLDQRRADECLNSSGRCIADAQPDDFWWRAVHQRQTPLSRHDAGAECLHRRCQILGDFDCVTPANHVKREPGRPRGTLSNNDFV